MNTSNIKTMPSAASDALDRVGDKAETLMNSKDQVVSDFKALLAEGESLLKNAAGTGDHAMIAFREKFQEQLAVAKSRFAELEQATVREAKKAATATNDYVHGNPWTAVAVAGGIGLLVGLVVSARRGD
jgi:ElaB/YqjD/DUF883 family membrane-anchored ribosome-binding protein